MSPVPGVSVAELLAGVALSRGRGEAPDAVEWSRAEWLRVWRVLTPVQQRVVFLHAVVGLGLVAVAEQLDQARGSVDATWRRALSRIREAIPT